MDNTFKITMMGPPGAGTRACILAMYHTWVAGWKSFTLLAKHADQHRALHEAWHQLYKGSTERRWPTFSTQKADGYEFTLRYGFASLGDFELIEYHGGALACADGDRLALKDQCLASSCLYLCVSGEHLSQERTENQLREVSNQSSITEMNQFLVELHSTTDRSDAPLFPVVLLITKFDLCRHRGRENILRDIHFLFEPLFQHGKGWYVLISPFSLVAPYSVLQPFIFVIHVYRSAVLQRFLELQLTADEDPRLLQRLLEFQENPLKRWLGWSRRLEELARQRTSFEQELDLEAIRKPFSYCCSEITQPPCDNERQADYKVRAC